MTAAAGFNAAPLKGAHAMLAAAWRDRRSLLSVGLEPCPEYLPASGEFAPTIEGYERWLMTVAESSAPFAAAYKFNLAFFEALGPEGWALLKRVRDRLPAGVMVIADAKRGDIGSTAKRYAQATFEWLNADSVTLSPLMGGDSAEPFLAYSNKLCFFLCLTSNPGSKDFLQRNGLSLDIALAVSSWGSAQQCGLVVGATQAGRVAEIRAAAPGATFLIPGVGAQGGDAEAVAREGLFGFAGETPPLLFHVTRGLFPERNDSGTFAEVVRRKAASYRDLFASAVDAAIGRSQSPKEAAHA